MSEITIYTNEQCPYCKQIKEELNNVELSMYDFVMGSTIMCEMGMRDVVPNLRKGLDWFRTHNAKAYMVLLD